MGKKSIWLLILGAASLIGTAVILHLLPEQVPLHWGVDGQVDRYGHRANVFITGGLPILMYGLMALIPRIDPRRDSYRKHRKAFSQIIVLLILFLVAIHWVTIAIALGADIDVQTFVCLAIAVLFVVVGNVLPRARPNYTFGIRTPWTLADEDVWRRTHRVGGYVFWIMALVFAAAAFIPSMFGFLLAMGVTAVGVVFVLVYSYILFDRKRKGGDIHDA